MSILQACELTKVYTSTKSRTVALSSFSASFRPGRSIAITGQSGSGKSTLLALLGLIEKPTSGILKIGDFESSRLSTSQRRSLRNTQIGWVFQNFSLINRLTALENATIPLRYNANVKPSEYIARGQDALRRVGLAEKADSFPDELSGGEQQRVAIARAIINSPTLLLADEPTGNLDSGTSAKIADLLLSTKGPGRSVILVTHEPDLAQRCDRVIHLQDGKIVNDSE